MTLEDELSDITADIVELDKNSVFLERLFSMDMGRWVAAAQLCGGNTDVEERLSILEKSLEGRLQVTWLDYPNSVYGQGYCVVIFFSEELSWNNIALYNKQQFVQKLASRTGGKEKNQTTTDYE